MELLRVVHKTTDETQAERAALLLAAVDPRRRYGVVEWVGDTDRPYVVCATRAELDGHG